MKFLGLDLEVNKRGIWNLGLAVFEGRKTLDAINIFVEETFSLNPAEGYGVKYFKNRETINKSRCPVWVQTLKDADNLGQLWAKAHGFSRSFGYNSNVFDLGKMRGTLPQMLELIESKPHIDVMPLAVTHLVGRKSFKDYWALQVVAGNTHEGNPNYAKFGAELVLNYLADTRAKKAGKTWEWKTEPHIGAEDLIGFEYPILHYFMRVLKKGMNSDASGSFLKW